MTTSTRSTRPHARPASHRGQQEFDLRLFDAWRFTPRGLDSVDGVSSWIGGQ
jgi:hypothetical protein